MSEAATRGAGRPVAALAGRRIDPADAGVVRFPLASRDGVRARLVSVLREHDVGVLVSSAACGSDLLALDAAADLGLERHVVLPFAVDRFRETSVVDRPGDWGPLFDRIVAEVAKEGRLVDLGLLDADEPAYERAAFAILDRAAQIAASRSARPLTLVVWDGHPRGPSDTTAAFRDEASRRGWPIVEILTLPSGKGL